MQFRSVFISIFIGTALIVAALLVTWENFVYGAPVFAPLLFANLAILATIGLWELLDE